MHLASWISHWAHRTPARTAIHFEGQAISYAGFERQISRLAWVLENTLNVSPGDRVAHLAYNNPVCLALVFACARIGAMLVPLNFRLAEPELAWLLSDSSPRVLFVDNAFLPLCAGTSLQPDDCGLVVLEPADGSSDCPALPALLADAERQDRELASVNAEDPILIVYTSGTTGQPKGAVLDQNSVRWNALNSQHMHAFHGDDHVLSVLPFFHVGGLNIQTLPAFHFGATVTVHRQFDPVRVLDTIGQRKPTLTLFVPTQMQLLVDSPAWGATDVSSLRAVATGSTVVDTTLLQAWRARGVHTLQVYGCTESSPIAINQCIAEDESPAGSAGRPARYCRVRLVDDDGNEVSDMEHGEVQLSGPNIMREYWNNPGATASTLRNGWLSTGDIGYRNPDGNYFIVDRKKNMIISGGENIYPVELETILLEHPDIEQAAVVGLPDKRWGEIVAAAVVTAPESKLGRQTIARLFEGRVGHFKHPKKIVFVSELPRNTMGKVLYADIRSMLQGHDPAE